MSLRPVQQPQPLASGPKNPPKYKSVIRDQKGQEISLGDPRATRSALLMMNMHAVIGGAACHWGGPAAFAEVMSALHGYMFQKEKWYDSYNFVNDIGHAENGIYALRANLGYGGLNFVDLKGFRSIESKFSGHGESHLYPEGVMLSNGPLASAFPQAQGLAMADKVSGNERITFCALSDGASMEGEAKEAFAAIAGLAQKKKINPFVLLLSDNNTKLSGRIDDDSFSMKPTFESLKSLGWEVVGPFDGHDLNDVYLKIENAVGLAREGKAVALWFKTIKGKGLKKTEESSSGGHGYPFKGPSELKSALEEIWQGEEIPKEFLNWLDELSALQSTPGKKPEVVTEKIQSGFARGASRAAKEGYPVFSLSSDLQGSTGMASFQKDFPDNFMDLGVAESNMVSAAAGMSRQGYIPIVDTFSAFGATKGNLPLIMASLSQSPVIAVFSHAGFQDAADGASHQSLTYLAAVGAIPKTKVLVPSTSDEAEELMYQAIVRMAEHKKKGKWTENIIFFTGRENFPKTLGEGKFPFGEEVVVRKGNAAVVAATGPMVHQAIEAAEELAKEGIELTIVNHTYVNDPEIEIYRGLLKENNNLLFTVEDHQLIAGAGAQLTHALHQFGVEGFKAYSFGVKGEFGRSAYSANELYNLYGIGKDAIVAGVKSVIK